ncbi:MAG TPA: N-acetylmuramoyl-L-alanine amidase, partial [Roseiflexaceae bacterium]
DLWQASDGPDVAWSATIAAGALARFWQVRADSTAAPDGALPELRRIDVNTIDASGPQEPAAALAPADIGALGKPSVVSRVGWGSPDGEGSRASPDYYPVNHMVVHHTADSNTLVGSERSWADRVRAEWAFHTYTRGWGDVGYNYLIDPNGVIYEGRAGGDDAVAFHDTANYGSMGVVLIGTYSSVPPTASAQNALVSLLAWKANQKQIDPLGRSYYYGCDVSSYCRPYNPGAIVPNIAGHRQVTPGHTSCPGDQAIAYLPGIRNRVKEALSGVPTDNGDLVIDELEGGFARSATAWHEASCGYGDHTYWTYTTDGAPENSATWRPNIATAGTYRVYAHIPQGCGLGTSPYASTQARYAIAYAGGSASRVVDHNTATEWVDLGAYQFNQGTGGAVELYDNTGEPTAAGKVLFFDAVKWVPENAAATNVQLTGVSYARTTLASGELLKVMFTVKNAGGVTIHSQQPHVDLLAGGGLNSADNGYVYDQDECFNGNAAGSYPAFPKESDRFRVTLGMAGWDSGHGSTCVGATGDYPWRWGLSGDLAPNAQQTIVGYVRFRTPGQYALQAGLIQEYVQYYAQGASPKTIAVTSEKIAPATASYDGSLRPLARVYRLGTIPDNFLARTRNPLSIPLGDYVGSFPWDGSFVDWGMGGPLGLTDQFVVEQTRAFLAPIAGTYTFRTTSDDGSWLWVDGQEVVVNNGLHAAADATGTVALSAGAHVLSFKYFERGGGAAAGYAVQLPGQEDFQTPPDGLGSGAFHLGGTFAETPDLMVAADDQGGSGVDHIRWSWDGASWQDAPGALLDLGRLVNGSYHLRYIAVDGAGNAAAQQDLVFAVDTDMTILRRYLPRVGW